MVVIYFTYDNLYYFLSISTMFGKFEFEFESLDLQLPGTLFWLDRFQSSNSAPRHTHSEMIEFNLFLFNESFKKGVLQTMCKINVA